MRVGGAATHLASVESLLPALLFPWSSSSEKASSNGLAPGGSWPLLWGCDGVRV